MISPPPATAASSPARRRPAGAVRGALAPLVAGAVALGGLTAWTATGAAGSPARIRIADARVWLPYAGNEFTVAFFRVRNTGGAHDRLVSVTSPDTGRAMLSRTVRRGATESMAMVDTAAVPAHGTLAMSASGVKAMVRVSAPLRLGDELPFVLRFRDSGPIAATARVVRLGG
ncbi:copper chaperone PCu(A)C [Streptomyces sp. ME19-01-6]|uniref:copper chaperone PCu(A)C n=1 Tax=Streptomyces sp. ME19-01-6 TaxID=3028686 RepID=UPI0029B47948|nr:copper chaperone PCu(A)C [Streptomyces sp. ME19-01-6]MDX3228518.1 copper chaperone PCu(A)C [Streptomyces sp. ME19-01-6]